MLTAKGSAWIENGYRYELRREWGPRRGRTIIWVMLNPSTADAEQEDATLRRIIDFSERWGNAGLRVVNLYALRATNPRELAKHPTPEGRHNRQVLAKALDTAGTIVAAWGNHGKGTTPSRWLMARAMDRERPLRCLGLTQRGAPIHPLRQPKDAKLRLWLDPFGRRDGEGLACADGGRSISGACPASAKPTLCL